jgi:hypothetical protein
MILYYTTNEEFEEGERITFLDGAKLKTQLSTAKEEVKSVDTFTYSLQIKSAIFDPCCHGHLHMLSGRSNNFRFAKLQDTANNLPAIEDKGFQSHLVQLGFRACIFYKNHEAFVFLLDELKLEVLKAETFSDWVKKLNIIHLN